MRLGIFQLDTSFEKLEENILYIKAVIEARNADLFICPELFNTGYDLEEVEKRSANHHEVMKKMAEYAGQFGVWFIPGTMAVKEESSVYNRMNLFDPQGRRACSYDKLHLFTLTGEERYFQPGKRLAVTRAGDLSLGLSVCYDLRFPELYSKYREAGAELFINVANWPASRIGHWKTLGRARAIENGCFIAGVNRTGEEGGLLFGGESFCYGPDGEEIVALGPDTDYVEVDIDPEKVRMQRKKLNSFVDRRTDIY